MLFSIGDKKFSVTLENNETAKAFARLLPLTINMKELNGNEKYFYLPSALPSKPEHINKINVGDVMLYGNDCLVIFFKAFTTPYSYTKLGKIEKAQALPSSLGKGDILVSFLH